MISKGFIHPLPEQQTGISYIIEGRDVIINGIKGKTSLALIGILERILESVNAPQAIILYPSTHNAQSAYKLCSELTSIMNIKSVLLTSEDTLGQHNIHTNNFAQIIFTTPWIVQKVISVNSQLFDTIKILVLDDAKKLLELHSFKFLIEKVV